MKLCDESKTKCSSSWSNKSYSMISKKVRTMYARFSLNDLRRRWLTIFSYWYLGVPVAHKEALPEAGLPARLFRCRTVVQTKQRIVLLALLHNLVPGTRLYAIAGPATAHHNINIILYHQDQVDEGSDDGVRYRQLAIAWNRIGIE
eukprot:scaffold130602_cov65-Attheya_sp.AAC.2